MSRRRGILATIALAGIALGLGPVPARAQESVFSLQFLGMSQETGDVRARGLGVLGIGIPDAASAITLNPAGQAALPRMTLSVMGLAGTRTSSEPGQSIHRGMSTFPHQRFALPVPGQLVMTVGFVGLRHFAGDFQLDRRSIGGIAYQQDFARSGTLYAIPLGLSRAVGSHLLLGATLDFTLGTADEAWRSTGDSLVALRTRRRDTYTGQSATLGVIVTPYRWLHVGATASPAVDLDRSERTTVEDPRITTGGGTHRDATVLTQVQFPATLRMGAAVAIGPRCMVTADGMRRDWASYDGRLYGAESVGLESRVGGGLEYRPTSIIWLGRMAYRVGVSRLTWPQRVGGNALRETALHLGAGLDLRGGMGRLDLGFEYARIGAIDRNGREETQYRFLLGFSGQESWKRRRPS